MNSSTDYLLDTNVISEMCKPRPDEKVLSFYNGVEPSCLFLSVLTLGELRKGVAKRKQSDALGAAKLAMWVDITEESFSDRILDITAPIAQIWGEASARRSIPVTDTLIAATALHFGLTLVTRNVHDMKSLEVTLFNPWLS